MALFEELKQRNVFRVAAAYAVVAWLVLQIVSVVEPALHLPDWTDTLVTVLVMLGFPIAVILAWVFDLTPDGIRRTASLPRESRPERSTGRRLDFLIIGALVLALGYFVVDKFWTRPESAASAPTTVQAEPIAEPAAAPAKSIAVLPFINRSDIEADQFFVDGIHDDLLTQIARIRDIKTISRTSVMAYRDTTKNMRTIGEELGVSTILEGGVQRAGAQVRINMQLIDTRTDAHLWAESFTRELTAENIFQIQSEITASVATALKAILSDEEQQRLGHLPTDNLEALEAYFRGREYFGAATTQGYALAITQFQRAAQLDPGFAAAYSFQGHALVEQIWYLGLDVDTQVALARPLITQAAALDPASSEVFNALGKLEQFAGNLDAAEAAYQRSIELGPNNAYAHADWGNLKHWQRDDPLAAIELFRKALSFDPQNLGILTQLAEAMSSAGQGAQAIPLLEAKLSEHPRHAGALRVLAALYTDESYRLDLAVRALRQAVALDPTQPWLAHRLGEVWWYLDVPEEVAYWMGRAATLAPHAADAPTLRGLEKQFRGEFEAAIIEFKQARLDTDLYPFARGFLARGLARDGRAEEAAALMIADDPQLGADPPRVDIANSYEACEYTMFLAAAGQTGRARQVGEAVLEIMEHAPQRGWGGYHARDALVYAVLGERERALAALREWVDSGGVSSIELDHLAWRDYANDPEFIELADRIHARQAEQRANIERWEAAGELPPVPPLPEPDPASADQSDR